jgi:hypothetical protein
MGLRLCLMTQAYPVTQHSAVAPCRARGFAPSIRAVKLYSTVLSALLLATAACGSKAATSGTSPTPVAAMPFDQMTHEQQGKFMKDVVVPEMAKLFQAYDAKKYAEFGCKTCHGPSVDAGKFDMPNPTLAKLNFADPSKMDPKAAEFMKSQVKPAMARLLQQPEYTPENPKGFGCLECHTMVEAPAAPAAAPGTGSM